MPPSVQIHCFDLRDPALLSPDELSSDEQRRTADLTTDTLRRRYTASHVALRRLLSSRLGIEDSRRLRFSPSRGGKPRLCLAACPLTFSLSRSGDLALVALGEGVDVGVDVEADHALFESPSFQDAVLTPSERACVEKWNAPDRASAVQRLWVRKEAIVKALGTGFTGPPASIESGDPGSESGLRTCGSVAVRWIVLSAPQDHAAAVAWCEPEGLSIRATAAPLVRLVAPSIGSSERA